MSPDTFAVGAGCAAAALWLLFALGRLNAMWTSSGLRANQLKQALVTGARWMIAENQRQKALDEQIAEAQLTLTELTKEQSKKRASIATAPPPPPDEIEVLAEFPSSRTDTAWVIDLALPDDVPAEQFGLPKHRYLMAWAQGSLAAAARGRQLFGATRYEVTGVRRFV